MTRRIVPWTFWGAVLALAVLLGAGGVRAARPVYRVPDLRGTWDGFFLGPAVAPTLGLIRADVTAQAQRRVAGRAALLEAGTGALFNGHNWILLATLPRDDALHGTGRYAAGTLTFGASLSWFPGVASAAGIQQAEYLVTPARGRPMRFDGLLLRPFHDRRAPDIAGRGVGRLRSEFDATFRGDLLVEFEPRQRGAYPGRFTFQPESDEEGGFTWPLRATTSANGRLVMIAQGKTGRAIYDGVVIPRADGTFFGGVYRLLFNDGRSNYGAYNFNLTAIRR
jgi:hypothetical protein